MDACPSLHRLGGIDQRRRDSNADGKGQARPASCQAKREPLPGPRQRVRPLPATGPGSLSRPPSRALAVLESATPSQLLLLVCVSGPLHLEGGVAVVATAYAATGGSRCR